MISSISRNDKEHPLAPLLAASLLLPAALLAQSGAGTIQGTVQDATRAAIPSCAVHVVNQATAVTNDTTTNDTGFYAVPGLFAGTYTVTFSCSGNEEVPDRRRAAECARSPCLNPKLTVGDVAEQVTVTGETVQLATYDSGTVSTQLDASRIDQLPQNGRNVLGLAQNTVPGLEGGGTRANGLMQEGMEYSQDGAPMTNRNFGGEANAAQATLPDPDSVQEAKFETLNSSAQFATPATVILTTKSGTNSDSTVRSSKRRATTISVSPRRVRIRPTSRRPTWCATNSAARSAARSSSRSSTTARTSRSSSSPTSASRCARPPTNW